MALVEEIRLSLLSMWQRNCFRCQRRKSFSMPETQSAPYPVPSLESDRAPALQQATTSWWAWLPYILIGLVITAIYYKVVGKLVTDWYDNPDFSHGFLVAPFAAFVIWDKRNVLRNTPIRQTWSGIWLIMAAIFVLFMGVYGAELFLSRLSLVMLLGGIVWTLLGRAMLREVRFAILVSLAGDSHSCRALQSDHVPAAAAGLEDGKRFTPAVRRSGSARWQHHPTSVDAIGGRGSLQRYSLVDEPVCGRHLLWLFSGAQYLAPGGAGAGRHPHRGLRQRCAHRWHRAVCSVLESG